MAAFPLSGTAQSIYGGAATYRGFTVAETSGAAPAKIRIWDSRNSATGTILDTVTMTASQSRAEFYPNGIPATRGVYVEVVSGAVEGSIRVN